MRCCSRCESVRTNPWNARLLDLFFWSILFVQSTNEFGSKIHVWCTDSYFIVKINVPLSIWIHTRCFVYHVNVCTYTPILWFNCLSMHLYYLNLGVCMHTPFQKVCINTLFLKSMYIYSIPTSMYKYSILKSMYKYSILKSNVISLLRHRCTYIYVLPNN